MLPTLRMTTVRRQRFSVATVKRLQEIASQDLSVLCIFLLIACQEWGKNTAIKILFPILETTAYIMLHIPYIYKYLKTSVWMPQLNLIINMMARIEKTHQVSRTFRLSIQSSSAIIGKLVAWIGDPFTAAWGFER